MVGDRQSLDGIARNNRYTLFSTLFINPLPAESIQFEAGDGVDKVWEFCEASAVAGGKDFPVLPVGDASFDS
ncbi:hypothetical protein C5D35_00875 [Rathayibacter toxicus]|nr:hypothetical protein C5D35_00875 [Rathayibacter toxicus]